MNAKLIRDTKLNNALKNTSQSLVPFKELRLEYMASIIIDYILSEKEDTDMTLKELIFLDLYKPTFEEIKTIYDLLDRYSYKKLSEDDFIFIVENLENLLIDWYDTLDKIAINIIWQAPLEAKKYLPIEVTLPLDIITTDSACDYLSDLFGFNCVNCDINYEPDITFNHGSWF